VAQRFDETRRVGGLSVVPDRSVGTGGRYSSRSQVRSGRGSPSAGCGGSDGDFLVAVSILTLWYVERSQETWKMNRQCFWWFLAAGVTISFGMVCIYYALDLGKVSVVIPIASTGPFFSLILAATFLRDVERVTSRIVLSAAMTVVGVVLLTLWK
jgi:uncharacterized membrane protein